MSGRDGSNHEWAASSAATVQPSRSGRTTVRPAVEAREGDSERPAVIAKPGVARPWWRRWHRPRHQGRPEQGPTRADDRRRHRSRNCCPMATTNRSSIVGAMRVNVREPVPNPPLVANGPRRMPADPAPGHDRVSGRDRRGRQPASGLASDVGHSTGHRRGDPAKWMTPVSRTAVAGNFRRTSRAHEVTDRREGDEQRVACRRPAERRGSRRPTAAGRGAPAR